MKKYFLLCILLALFSRNHAQLSIGAGARWINSGNVSVNIQDLDFLNNGNFVAGTSLLKFTGGSNKNIGGTSVTTFYDLEIAKTGKTKILLQLNTGLAHALNFTSGLFDLNQQNLVLSNTAFLNNENENSRMTGLNGGEAIIVLNLNNPNNINPGNLGAIISSATDLGSVTVKRGHKMETGNGLTSSISRYFNIQPANNSNLNATLRMKYFDAELNSQSENTMILYKSENGGSNWTSQPITSRDVALNYVEKNNIASFSLWTASSAVNSPLPITGLQFSAKRINGMEVKLDWKTMQEIDNLGFYIERKKENENDFTTVGFVPSKAINGNSSFPLEYEKTDTLNYSGKSYYRLKQMDVDGKFFYSAIRLVTGGNEKQIVLKVWPVPAVKDFSIMAEGIDKTETVRIFDMTGKLVRSINISNETPQKINGLAPGSYIIKLDVDNAVSQKLIVQ